MERHFQNFWKFLFSSYANRPKFTLTSKLNFSACEGHSRKPPVPGEGPTYWLSNGVPQLEFRGFPLGRFWPQRGVTFSRFLAIFPKFWKKIIFFLLFFERALGYLQKDKKNLDQLSFLWEIWQIQNSGLLGPLWGVAFLKWPFRGLEAKFQNFI